MLANAFTAHHFAARVIGRAIATADQNTERSIGEAIQSFFKIPKVILLATLLDVHSGGHHLGAVDESDVVDRQ